MMIEIRPLQNSSFGAEIFNIDFKKSMDTHTINQINAAFLKYIVLIFKDQNLTSVEYEYGVSNFGTPMKQHNENFQLPDTPVISRIINREKMRPASMWHTDHTNHECPPKSTILYARTLPSQGGDTCIADMYTGLDYLDKNTREKIKLMRTINHMETDNFAYSVNDRAKFDNGVTQPMIRTHPDTGRKALYFHITKARGIVGMDEKDVRPFLEDLLMQAIKPENTLRHKWQEGDILMFDNRCTMHRADTNYNMSEERLLWRVILSGDRPV